MNIKRLFGFGALELPEIISIDDLGMSSTANAANALGIASFYRGVNIISNSIASLPFKVYKGKDPYREHEAFFLLKHKSNDFQTSFEFINTMVMIMLVKGNAFAKINRNDNGSIRSLDIIAYESVEAIMFNDKLFFVFDGSKDKTYANEDLIHFKNIGTGYLGTDVVRSFRRNLEISINSTSYTNKVYTGEASSVRGTITYDKALNKEQRERLRQELSSNFSGRNGKKILFLEDGMKLNNITLDPSQTQFLESRRFEREEIASMLNLPIFMLNGENQTSTGIEADNIRFYQTTLLPLITKIEKELENKLLTREEILSDVYVKASVNALLRGDSKSRGEFYKQLFYLGAISPDEIRRLEDMSEEILGETYIQANLIPMNIVNRFWDSKARETYSKAELNEQEFEQNEEENEE